MPSPKAPSNVVIQETHIASERSAMIEKLNKEHPEYTHVFERVGRPDSLRASKGIEVVKGSTYNKNGDDEPLYVGRDVVARIRKKDFDALNTAKNERSFQKARAQWQGEHKEDDGIQISSDPTGPVGKGKMIEKGKFVPDK